MGVAIRDLKGKVKRPVRTVTVCLDGDLWARHDELSAKLDALRAQTASRMAPSPEVTAAAEELRAVEDAMREAQVTIEFRGISSFKLAEIQARFPAKDGRGWDVNAGAPALIAACAVEPTTEDEARELLEEVNYAVSDKLFAAAWDATTGSSDVPFSLRASALISGSGSK
jgi:hypothetical protein